MKSFLLTIAVFAVIFSLHAQSADEVLARYEVAAGGKEQLTKVKQLEVFGTVKMNVMGQAIELPQTLIREEGKLFRRQLGGIMGMGDSYTVITDTGGYVFIPSIRGFGDMPGTAANLIKMEAKELASQQYELDCAGAFGELVDYKKKGHSAEVVGTEKINKQLCTKVKFTHKTGQVLFYYFDNTSGLVKKAEATGEMAANLTGFGGLMKTFGSGSKNMKAEIIYKDYQDVSGIKFPSKYTISLGPVETEIENTTIKINEGLDIKWFKVGK